MGNIKEDGEAEGAIPPQKGDLPPPSAPKSLPEFGDLVRLIRKGKLTDSTSIPNTEPLSERREVVDPSFRRLQPTNDPEQFFRLAGDRGFISEDPERTAQFLENFRASMARTHGMFEALLSNQDGTSTKVPGTSAEPRGQTPLFEAEKGARNERIINIMGGAVTGNPDILGKLIPQGYGPALPPKPSSEPGPKGGKP